MFHLAEGPARVIRHVDAGYDQAARVAAEHNVHIPLHGHDGRVDGDTNGADDEPGDR